MRTPDSRSTLPGDHETATVSIDHAFSMLKLTTTEIVEFLKSPLVQGDHGWAFLDLLECRYGRRFGNPCAFVEYAPAEDLGLDFTVDAKQPPRETSVVAGMEHAPSHRVFDGSAIVRTNPGIDHARSHTS